MATDPEASRTESDPCEVAGEGTKSDDSVQFVPQLSAAIAAMWANIENVGRVFAIGAVALYALGLLVTNVYLFQIGVSDFSVLRTRFIMTGALVVLILAAAAVYILAAVVVVTRIGSALKNTRNQHSWKSREFALAFVSAVALIAVFGQLVPALVLSDIHFKSVLLNEVFGTLGGFLVATTLFALYAILLYFIPTGPLATYNTGNPMSPLWLAMAIAGLFGPLLTLIFFVDVFAGTFYPRIPEQIGGGRPKPVELIFSDEGSRFSGALGLNPEKGDPLSRQLDLVWETETSYIVRSPDEPNAPYIQVARGAVSAVVFVAAATPTSQK